MVNSGKHRPVLLEEVVKYLVCDRLDVPNETLLIFDGTVGGGGHSEALLESSPLVKIVGMDQDDQAISRSARRLARFGDRVILRHGNFRNFAVMIEELRQSCPQLWLAERRGAAIFDGIVIDLGFSSDQLEDAQRGFSFNLEGPLDMRLNRANPLTAAEIINNYATGDLLRMFRMGGVRTGLGPLVRELASRRPFETTAQLAAVVREVFNKMRRKQRRNKNDNSRSDPATVVFQAIRIAVNDELGALAEFMEQALSQLVGKGRLAIISFHSLEDKIVTQAMRSWEHSGQLARLPVAHLDPRLGRLLTKRPVVPSSREVEQNPRSRSARLRVFERTNEGQFTVEG